MFTTRKDNFKKLNSVVPYLAIVTRLVRIACRRLGYYNYDSDLETSGVLLLTDYIYLPIITKSVHG